MTSLVLHFGICLSLSQVDSPHWYHYLGKLHKRIIFDTLRRFCQSAVKDSCPLGVYRPLQWKKNKEPQQHQYSCGYSFIVMFCRRFEQRGQYQQIWSGPSRRSDHVPGCRAVSEGRPSFPVSDGNRCSSSQWRLWSVLPLQPMAKLLTHL